MTRELLDRFEAGVGRLLSTIEDMRLRNEQLEAEADNLRIHAADRDRLEQRVNELEANLGTMGEKQRELEVLRGQLESTQRELGEVRTKAERVSSLEGEVNTRENRISELEWLHGEVVAERDRLRAEVEQALNVAGEVETKLNEAGAERDRLRGELQTAQQLLESAKSEQVQIEALRAESTDFRQRLEAAVGRETQMKDRLHMLIQRIEETENLLQTPELTSHAQS